VGSRLPLWLAPNALTLAGAAAAVASGLLLWACSPGFEDAAPVVFFRAGVPPFPCGVPFEKKDVASPSFRRREDAVPAWAELLAAGLVLLYQTCDAVDGLQARRTGTSSALGGPLATPDPVSIVEGGLACAARGCHTSAGGHTGTGGPPDACEGPR